MQAPAATSQTTRLAAGQSFHVQARAGTCIIVKSGRIDVAERSVWLCDRFVVQRSVVRDGEQYTLRQSGWIALQAREPAMLLCMTSAKKDGVLVALRCLWANIIAGLRRRLPRSPA